ncbi:MAG: hypothetical protein RMM58_13355 [Chloroflexota bacterium]|nr:hypothetical protein [Dehalococcoidia bacterium]MDW8254857.1 hypothetical protein [Chloroflexota bacterium]
MDQSQLEEFRQLLLAERKRLEMLIAGARRDIVEDTSEVYNQGGGVAAHYADIATDLYDREQALSLEHDFEQRLHEVNHALWKIEQGTYGFSEQSGKPIPVERLRAIPWARFTIEEERELERRRS